MTTKRFLWTAGVLAVLCAAIAAPVRGETFDRRTVFTFNRPISVPGVDEQVRRSDPLTRSSVVTQW